MGVVEFKVQQKSSGIVSLLVLVLVLPVLVVGIGRSSICCSFSSSGGGSSSCSGGCSSSSFRGNLSSIFIFSRIFAFSLVLRRALSSSAFQHALFLFGVFTTFALLMLLPASVHHCPSPESNRNLKFILALP